MTTTQTVFVVFFAIFWGAIFSVQGRWKMFQPLLRFPHVRHRFVLSITVVNFGPILFFVWAFFCLNDTPVTPPLNWRLSETFLQLIAGIFPAFAIFGFYRVWMGIVELAPKAFYQKQRDQNYDLRYIHPTVETLNLNHALKGYNFLFAGLYFALAGLGVSVGIWLS